MVKVIKEKFVVIGKEGGVIDVAATLRELQKKRDDNALFDSFNMHN